MTLLESIHLAHLPPDYTAHVTLYRNVTNAAFLHQQLLSANTEFEYAFIDASVIVSRTHALAATFRAVNDLVESRLKTRNVHSEIVFCLSPNNNIADSFRRFGINPSPHNPTTNLLIIKISTPSSTQFTSSSIQSHLDTVVQGTQVRFTDEVLGDMTDWTRVRKIYKLGGGAGGSMNGGGMTEKRQKDELRVQILGTMALRGQS